MAKFSEFGVLELNSYQKVSLKAIKGAETFLFSFPPGLGSGYVSRVWHLPVHQCTLVEDAQSILLVVKPTNLSWWISVPALLRAAFQLPINQP